MIAFILIFVFAAVVFYLCAQGGAAAEAIYGVIGIMMLFFIIAFAAASC
jgi:hypothetical protein